jgi:TonB family protein
MNLILRYLLLWVMFGLMLHAKGQTTMEEYIYLSRTLKESVDRSVLPGYSFGDMSEWETPLAEGSDARRITRVVVLYRASGEPAGVLVVMKRTDTDHLKTICVPMPDSDKELLRSAWGDFESATSDWSAQSKVYCWHLAMAVASQVAKSSNHTKTETDEQVQHPIDRDLDQCLRAVVRDEGDPMGTTAELNRCYSEALERWQAELKKTEIEVLYHVGDVFKAELDRSFLAWHEAQEQDPIMSVIADTGSDKVEPAWFDAKIETIKSRVAVVSVLLGTPSMAGAVGGDGWDIRGSTRELVSGPDVHERLATQHPTWVEVKVVVDRNGHVLRTTIANAGSPDVAIQNAALRAAKTCRFVQQQDGPIEQVVYIKFRFFPR